MDQETRNEGIESPLAVTFLGDFSKKLATNTFFNFVGRFWSFLVTLLLTPYILHHLGVADFGVWVLLAVFAGSFNLLDAGFGSSFIKYVSEYHAHGDDRRINIVLSSGLAFYTAFGLVLVSAGWALGPFLFGVFRMSPDPGVYALVLAAFALNNIALMILSMLKGLQRMDKSNAVEIQVSAPNVIGTVAVLEMGWGMLGLAINAVIVALATGLLGWRSLRRVRPQLRTEWRIDPALLGRMVRYGLKLQVSRLGGVVCFQVDKLILSRFLGVAAVSFYEVASRLALFMRALPLVMLSALIPATSELGARNDRARILRTYQLASKYVVMTTVALAAFVFVEAGPLLRLWLGAGFEESIVLVQILAIGYGVNVMGGAASQTGAGVGRPEFDMKGTILLTVLNPLLSVLLVRQLGAPGAALGTSLALLAGAAYLLQTFHRHYLDGSILELVRDVHLRPWAGGVLAAASVWGARSLFPGIAALGDSRILIPVQISLELAVFAAAYIAVLAGSRHVTIIDWRNFTGLVSFGFAFVRNPVRQRVKIYR